MRTSVHYFTIPRYPIICEPVPAEPDRAAHRFVTGIYRTADVQEMASLIASGNWVALNAVETKTGIIQYTLGLLAVPETSG